MKKTQFRFARLFWLLQSAGIVSDADVRALDGSSKLHSSMVRRIFTLAVFMIVLGMQVRTVQADAPQQPERIAASWRVGYAEADITPQLGDSVMLAGFGKKRIVEGIESPLRAQALAFEDSTGKRCVLLTADVLGFGRNTVDAVRYKLHKTHQLDPSAVCLAASHTHWGPAVNERTCGGIGDPNVWYLGFLETTLLELADKALGSLAPAEVTFGECEVRIGMCRRRLSADGEVRWAPDPSGSYDAHTPIVHVRRDESPRQLILTGHACHPTSMGETNQWSPDYPGAMRRKLEGELDDSRALFVMGCGADAKVVTKSSAGGEFVFAADPVLSYQAGEKLADAVLTRLHGERPLTPLVGELSTSLVRGKLGFQKPWGRPELERLAFEGSLTACETWWARKNLAFPDERTDLDYAVQAWRLGDLTCIALEGEVCADWGPLARSMATTGQAMTIGYANEVSGYIPTARIIGEGGYEGERSHRAYLLPAPFAPAMEVELTELIGRCIARLTTQEDHSNADSRGAIGDTYPDKNQLLIALDAAGNPQAVTTPQQWESRRRHIIENIVKVTGPVPQQAFRVPLELEILEETDCGTYSRRVIAYNVDPYDRVESELLIPKQLRGPAPAILALHGTHPLGKRYATGNVDETTYVGKRSFYGHELAERGYIVLAPDYWFYGYYEGQEYSPYQHGYASATMKGIWNHMRAIDVLEQLPEVDVKRMGAIGHSLGGYNTLFLGVFDPRIQVMVSNCGYNAFADYAASEYGGGDLAKWGIDKHMRRIRTVFDNDPSRVPFDFPGLLATLAPRPVFTIATLHDECFDVAGVRKCLVAARPVYELLGVSDPLPAIFLDTTHEFSDTARQAAYEFLDQHLRNSTPPSPQQ